RGVGERTREAGRERPAVSGVCELCPVPRLRGSRRALPPAGGGDGVSGATVAAAPRESGRQGSGAKRLAPPLEHRMLLSATLCLLAFGAVMVYSASSPLGVLSGRSGTGTGEFVRYLIFGGLGLVGMHVLARRGVTLFHRRLVTLLLFASFVLLLLVLVPGFGVQVNGARRWFAAGPIQFQPSELMKLALVLYVARYLAEHPKRMRGLKEAV